MARERPGVDLADLERVVTNQAGFFDLRDEYTKLLESPAARRALLLANLPQEGFGRLVSLHRGKTLYENLGPDFLRVAQVVRPDIFKNPLPGTLNYDFRLETPGDTWTGVAADILKDPSLAQNFVTTIEQRAQTTTKGFLKKIDDDREKNVPTEVEVVIVGEGPLAAHVASQLGAIYGDSLVLFTKSDTLMGPWEHRGLYLNSSDRDRKINAPVIGGTTPVFATGSRGVRVADLVGGTLKPLRVVCNDGSLREYPSARALALAKTINLAANVSQFVVGADVMTDEIGSAGTSNGFNEVKFRDSGGKLRTIRARQVFLATGPGVDNPDIRSELGGNLARGGLQGLRTQIDGLRVKYERKKELMRLAEEASGSPDAMRYSDEAQKIQTEEPLRLPKVLTLTAVEEALSAWRKYQGAELALNPLNPLFDPDISIGVVGSNDGARTWVERLKAEGPVSGRPEFSLKGQPKLRVYGLGSQFSRDSRVRKETYSDRTRVRYLASLDGPGVTATRAKVDKIDLGDDGKPRVLYTPIDRTVSRSHDYVYVATGLRPDNYQPAYFDTASVITASDGGALAVELRPGVVVLGSANQFQAEQLPNPIRRILSAIGVGENTVSLWANGILANRAVLMTQTRRGVPSSDYLARLALMYTRGMRTTAGEVLADVGKGEALIRMYGETPEKPTLIDALNAQVGTIAQAALGLTRSRFLSESFEPKEISREIEFGPRNFTEPNPSTTRIIKSNPDPELNSNFPRSKPTRITFPNIDLGVLDKFKKQNNIK